MLAEYLESHGLGVEPAARPTQGLSLLKTAPFEDVMLPEMDGFEVVSRIRATSDIPILMLTARGEETDRIIGLELGAEATIYPNRSTVASTFTYRESAPPSRKIRRTPGRS